MNHLPEHQSIIGLGIRPELFADVESGLADELGFFEAHSENYFGHSIAREKLQDLRRRFPVSLHGVGLSLGRADGLDKSHLTQLRELVDLIDPLFVSEHLSWSAYQHRQLPDLLPLPLNQQAFATVCQHVAEMQDAVGRQILIENPSNYLLFNSNTIPEHEFLNELCAQTGCGLLLDVNNVYVSASNLHLPAHALIEQLDSSAIKQYHLAGYTEVVRDDDTVLIDTHNQPVHDPVWRLFEQTLVRHGARPTLFEWDSDFPELDVLLAECQRIASMLPACSASQAATVLTTAKNRQDTDETDLHRFQGEFLDNLLGLQETNCLTAIRPEFHHRLQVYENNVYAAVLDYLQEVYPATMGVLGEAYFRQIMRQFVRAQPPAKGDINLYGESWIRYISSIGELSHLVYLADLARLEWAMHELYFSETETPLNSATVQQAELLTHPVKLNNSVRIIQSAWPVYEIHRQSLPDYAGEVHVNLADGPDNVLLYKTGGQVILRRLTDEQAFMLLEVQTNDTLLDVIDGLSASLDSEVMSATLALAFELSLLAKKPTATALYCAQ